MILYIIRVFLASSMIIGHSDGDNNGAGAGDGDGDGAEDGDGDGVRKPLIQTHPPGVDSDSDGDDGENLLMIHKRRKDCLTLS